MRRVPHKLARLAVLRSALPRNANDKPEVATINIEGTEKVIPIDIEDCKKAPQDAFWQKLEAGWKRVEADMKSLEKKL